MSHPLETTRGERPRAPLPPVVKTIVVAVSPGRAFDVFTSRFDRWWPRASHSVSRTRAKEVLIEPRLGGFVGEVRDDGERFEWGRVRVWDPPRRLVTTWHPGGVPEVATQVEVTFDPEGSGTRVTLTHIGWEVLGDRARETRDGYDGGWQHVFVERFAEACES